MQTVITQIIEKLEQTHRHLLSKFRNAQSHREVAALLGETNQLEIDAKQIFDIPALRGNWYGRIETVLHEARNLSTDIVLVTRHDYPLYKDQSSSNTEQYGNSDPWHSAGRSSI